jgi:hypothetical protein
MEKVIQFDTNWKMGNLFFNQGIKENRKQTPTKAMGMHVGGEQTKGGTLMRWMLTH